MPSLDDFTSSYDRFRKNEIAAFAHNRDLIFTALAARGIRSVEIVYEGSGDSGAIEDRAFDPAEADSEGEITILKSQWDLSEPVATTHSLVIALEETAMSLVERDHGGWENNEGGGGTVTFDVEAREITVAHHNYYVQRDESMHTY